MAPRSRGSVNLHNQRVVLPDVRSRDDASPSKSQTQTIFLIRSLILIAAYIVFRLIGFDLGDSILLSVFIAVYVGVQHLFTTVRKSGRKPVAAGVIAAFVPASFIILDAASRTPTEARTTTAMATVLLLLPGRRSSG